MEQRAVRFPRPAERGEVDTVKLRSYLAAAAMKLVSAIIVAVAISMPAIREHFAFEKRRHAARARRTVTNREGQ